MQPLPLTFDSPIALVAGLFIATAAVGIGFYRRPAVPRLTAVLATAALFLLAVAAGGPGWRGAGRPPVTVMVDLSPSTRGATYRDRAALHERVRRLLGGTPYRTVYFADGDVAAPANDPVGTNWLSDVPAAQTRWTPGAAASVLLFSDARFEPPAFAPPTFVVVDRGLEAPADAAVERLEVRDAELWASVRNGGTGREVTLATAGGAASRQQVPPGGAVVVHPLAPGSADPWTARLAPGDLWPENDSLSLALPPPAEAERWWVGNQSAVEGWRSLSPAGLPSDAAAFLRPSAIVLDNVAATDLGDGALRRLREYVTGLGGGLVILGGDNAFAAGGYAGTILDALSPLSPHPPEPSTHWVFVVDSSGSMSARVSSGGTRWSAAVDAVARAASALPPHDPVSVAGFAAGLNWWVRGKPSSELAPGAVPPPDARPSGPTELRRALAAAASGVPAGPPVELLVLTDGKAPVEDPAALATEMRGQRMRLHLLDIGDASGEGLPALRQIVEATGGTLLRESDPAGWPAAVRRLTRAAAPELLVREPATVAFTGPLAGAPDRTVAPPWNRTWLKPRATAIATGPGDAGPLAAAWAAGEGQVVAAAFGARPEEASPFVRLAARQPRDPRLRVTWDAGAALRVSVDALAPAAADAPAGYLNGLLLTLELHDAAGAAPAPTVALIPQVAPGRYELSVPAPAGPAVATLRRDRQVVDRVAVAGRYPAEFERIGNDHVAMRSLADRTGGAVIEPSETGPLGLNVDATVIPLTSAAAAAASVCLAAALIRWRAH